MSVNKIKIKMHMYFLRLTEILDPFSICKFLWDKNQKTGCFLALELTTDLVSIWVLAKGTTHTDQTLVCSPGNTDQVEPRLVIINSLVRLICCKHPDIPCFPCPNSACNFRIRRDCGIKFFF